MFENIRKVFNEKFVQSERLVFGSLNEFTDLHSDIFLLTFVFVSYKSTQYSTCTVP